MPAGRRAAAAAGAAGAGRRAGGKAAAGNALSSAALLPGAGSFPHRAQGAGHGRGVSAALAGGV